MPSAHQAIVAKAAPGGVRHHLRNEAKEKDV
jgi:hypothetical protein